MQAAGTALVAILAGAGHASASVSSYGPAPAFFGAAGTGTAATTQPADTAVAIPQPSVKHGSIVAAVLVAAPVQSSPGGGRSLGTLGTFTALEDEPEVATVLGAKYDAQGKPWIRVGLPNRPNESSGWISANDAILRTDRWFITVDQRTTTVSVYHDGRLAQRAEAVIGAPSTPTPTGLFSVYDIVPQTPASGFLGPYTVQLTAFSDVFMQFGAGPGRIAIHGRGGASLIDPLGSADSHGCIRVDNSVVEWIAGHVPLGTSVDIT